MKKLLAAFLRTYTFQRQLGITITLGIFLLALFSSLVGSWQSNERARRNILEQGQLVTENLARQSSLALIYASGENAAEAANATMAFPGVAGLEVRDVKQRILLARGSTHLADLLPLTFRTDMTGRSDETLTAAVLEAENQDAWRFVAPVYSRPSTDSPVIAKAAAPELLGYVAVVMSKAALTKATTSLFIANLATSFSFALLFLLLIRFLTNRMVQPLNRLSASMGRAEAGETQVRTPPAGPKDIADMAHAFNRMMSVLEEREAALRVAAIAFESQEGMFVTDANKAILRVNHAFTDITGYTAEDATGKNPHILSSGLQDANFYAAMWESINRTGAWRGEIWNQRKNGETYPEYATITAVKDPNGAVTNYVATLSDITERKKTEAALAASRAKSEFLANMSHEIRTPMNGVVGMVDILQQTELDHDQQRMVGTIQESSLALLNILNDILDFSKIEAGKLEIERMPTPLREVVEGVAQLMATAANAKSVELSVFVSPQLPHWIASDTTRLRQVLLNLLGNAVKFTSSQNGRTGKVALRAEPSTLADGRPGFKVRVIDNGIGMSPETQKKLFQPFTQADESTSRKFGGTGLGLSISQRLVELMGGRIEVRSTLGEGTEFSVELPLEETAPGRQIAPEPDLTGVRVLVVAGNAETLTAYCRAAGADVTVAADLTAARSQLQQMQSSPATTVLLLDLDVTTENEPGLPEAVRVVQLVLRGRSILAAKAVPVHTRPLLYHDLIHGVALASGRLNASDIAALNERRRQPRITAPTIEEAVAAHRLILLAEDNETNREVVQEQLRLLGYTAEMAEDGAVALEMWRTGRYALLLTDCHMPYMDGFELTAAIRGEEAPGGTHLPIVAVTANAMQGESERCIARGMDDYLSKPLRLDELGAMLAKWLPLPRVAAAEETATEESAAADQGSEPGSPATGGYVPITAGFPVWDATALTRMVGDNPDMHRRLLEKFLVKAQEQVAAILSAVAAGDAATVGSVAHTFKSAARTVGAMQLGELCQQMEMAGKAGDGELCNTLAKRLNGTFESAAEKINRNLN